LIRYIRDIFADARSARRPVVSFEFFPTKTDEGERTLLQTTIPALRRLGPDFCSVTYGAGGGTRDKTLAIVDRIQREQNLTAMAHLTCAASSQDDICEEVGRLLGNGIENILALRGDLPKGQSEFKPIPGGFQHATDLIGYLEDNYLVDVGAACYPEKHQEAADADTDLRHLKAKVDAGVDFLITQLFYDNRDYFAFVDRARSIGITVPIVPGIMPITNLAQIKRITSLSAARIPAELLARLEAASADAEAVRAIGVEHATAQCRGLVDGGAPGVHFYTLNRSLATRHILDRLRAA